MCINIKTTLGVGGKWRIQRKKMGEIKEEIDRHQARTYEQKYPVIPVDGLTQRCLRMTLSAFNFKLLAVL